MKSEKIFGISGRSTATVIFVLMAVGTLSFGWQRIARSQTAAHENKTDNRSRAATIRADKQSSPILNLADGYDLGAPGGQFAGEQPTHLASADLDSDGVPDLLTADASGKVRFYKGNSVIHNKGADPFESTGKAFQLGFAPDFFETGDLNADGNKDVLAAAKGGNVLELLAGNGRGDLVAARSIPIDGSITSVATGEIGQADGQTDVAVAVTNQNGAFLLVFEHPEGAFAHPPEIIKLPGAATDLAIGDLDGDLFSDIVVASGTTLTVVHERGQAYPWDIVKGVNIQRPPAVIETRVMSFAITGMAVGNFSNEREQSLAVLSDDSSVYRLHPTIAASIHGRISGVPASKGTAPKNLPTGAGTNQLRVTGKQPNAGFSNTDGMTSGRLSSQRGDRALMLEKQDRAAKKYLALSRDERGRQKAESADKLRISRQHAKAGFLRAISAQPSTLAGWQLEGLINDVRVQAGNASAGKKLFTGRVSNSVSDDLLFLDSASGQIQVVTQPNGKMNGVSAAIVSLDVDGSPADILPLRRDGNAKDDLVVLRHGASQPSFVPTKPTSVITVNDTGDQIGDCSGGGTCTLRSAMIGANSQPGSTIAFNIAGAGVHTIEPTSELPVINANGTSIDGTTQPGFTGFPLIEIKGDLISAGTAADGVKIRASNCEVGFLAINQFPFTTNGTSAIGGNSITIESLEGTPVNVHNEIIGNFLGTDPTGTIAKGANSSVGLLLFTADNNYINGNLLSGNRGFGLDLTDGNNNQIVSNYIGLAIDGITPLGNSNGVFLTGGNNQFGGDGAGQGNKVSGNGIPVPGGFPSCRGGIGVEIPILFNVETGQLRTTRNLIKGNNIGTSADGNQAAGNCTQGIITDPVAETVIGSIDPNGRNTVSGNGYDAIYCKDTLGAATGSPSDGGFCAIVGNNIGTNSAGSAELGNDHRDEGGGLQPLSGIVTIDNGNTLSNFGAPGGTTPGGSCTGFCNLISGNAGGDGIQLNGYGTMGVFNNYIGTDITGTRSLQNRFGTPAISPSAVSADIFIGGLGAQFGVPDTSLGNLISGNTFAVEAEETSGTLTIEGNLVGTDAQGINAVPNGCTGCSGGSITIANSGSISVQIGDTDPMARNIISGNALDGISFLQNPDSAVTIVNNAIGVNSAGDPLPNTGAGISFFDLGGATIGGSSGEEQNLIQNNGHAGILLLAHVPGGQPVYPGGVNIQGNKIKNNGGLGIDLSAGTTDDGVTANDCGDADAGPNQLQNYPVLAAPVFNGDGTVSVSGTLKAEPFQSDRIDLYSNTEADPTGYGEGENYIGSVNVVTDGNGFANIAATSSAPVPGGSLITATNTNQNGSTSEFSCVAGQCVGNAPDSPTAGCIDPMVVNNTTDDHDADVTDGVCDTNLSTPGFQCSLRAVIEQANDPHAITRSIKFDIPGAGVQTITPATPLPTITMPVHLYGSTQGGDPNNHLIEISGSNAGTGAVDGLILGAGSDGSTIEGLVVDHFHGGYGVYIQGSSNNEVESCYLGLNPDGLTFDDDPATVQLGGIGVESGAASNTIGGPGDESNVITGNTKGIFLGPGGSNKVVNNKIGVDKNGNQSSQGTGSIYGIQILNSNNNTIGGDLGSAGNLISASELFGIIAVGSNGTKIRGNYIGTDGTGQHPAPNKAAGIAIDGGSAGTTIGGTNPLDRNIISGNNFSTSSVGIDIGPTAAAGNQILGNYIGVGPNADNPVPNSQGVLIFANGTIVGSSSGPNIISGNTGPGIDVVGSSPTLSGTSIVNNLIGINANSEHFRNGVGVLVSGDVENASIRDNTISGNVDGVGVAFLLGPGNSVGPSNNTIFHNRIGVDRNGTTAVANGIGVSIAESSSNSVIGNVISGNSTLGISIGNNSSNNTLPTSQNVVQANLIGTNADGTAAIPNMLGGVGLIDNAQNNLVGGSIAANQGNMISGNTSATDSNVGYGVFVGSLLAGSDATHYPTLNRIQGNHIGLNKTEDTGIPNTWGVYLDHAANNTIGGDSKDLANVIGENVHDGVYIIGSETTGNVLNNNYIGVSSEGNFVTPNQGDGISVLEGAVDTTIKNNVVSGNLGNGIEVADLAPSNNQKPGVKRPSDFSGSISIVGNLVGAVQNIAGGPAEPAGNGLSGIILECVQQAQIGDDLSGASNIISANHATGITILQNLGNRPQRPRRPGSPTDCISDGNTIVNAIIGTDAAGTPGLGNTSNGIQVSDSNDVVIGKPGAGNVIAGNQGNGISLQGGSANSIAGNNVGVVPVGGDFAKAPNEQNGIDVAGSTNDQIGGAEQGAGNTVAANTGEGILIDQLSANLTIRHNLIGTVLNNLSQRPDGKAVRSPSDATYGNGRNGVLIENGSHNIEIGDPGPGDGNDIEFNALSGVDIDSTAGSGNLIDPNSIAGNGKLGIDLGGSGVPLPNDAGDGDADSGPNNLQDYPEFSSAIIAPSGDLILRYKVDSDPTNSNYGGDGIYVEFFKGDASLQGQTFLGSTHYTADNYTAAGPGIVSFNAGNAAALGIQTGDKIVATATDADGNTSEFTGTNVGVVVAPTAATVQISGRVLTSDGSGVRGAIVTATDTKGIARSVLTNAFGYYTVDAVRSGESYVVRASARLHTFGPRLINVTDSLTDLDFVDRQ